MSIKINSNEINRMLKVINQCTNPKDFHKSNVCISACDSKFYMNSSDGQMNVFIEAPHPEGGEVDPFCVDAQMLSRVCANCSGDVTLSPSAKSCTITGTGRTKIPVVDAKIPKIMAVNGTSIKVDAAELAKAYGKISPFVASPNVGKVILTGVHIDVRDNVATLVAIDGFTLAKETIKCEGVDISVDIPNAFMKLLTSSVQTGEITLTFDRLHAMAYADGFLLTTVMLAGAFPAYDVMIPKDFTTSILVSTSSLLNTFKSASVVRADLIKMSIVGDEIRFENNNQEEVEFDASIECKNTGADLNIAFNQRFLSAAVSSIGEEEVVMNMNEPTSPCIITSKDGNGLRLVLPLRIFVGGES